MVVTLAGPDDHGFWFLDDQSGRSFQLVGRFEDHPQAAALLGWKAPEGVTHEKEIILDAIDWLIDHTSDDFKAPIHVVEYFNNLGVEP